MSNQASLFQVVLLDLPVEQHELLYAAVKFDEANSKNYTFCRGVARRMFDAQLENSGFFLGNVQSLLFYQDVYAHVYDLAAQAHKELTNEVFDLIDVDDELWTVYGASTGG